MLYNLKAKGPVEKHKKSGALQRINIAFKCENKKIKCKNKKVEMVKTHLSGLPNDVKIFAPPPPPPYANRRIIKTIVNLWVFNLC